MLHILDQVTCEETIVDKFLWPVDGAGRPPGSGRPLAFVRSLALLVPEPTHDTTDHCLPIHM